MDANKLLAVLLLVTGVADIVLARALRERLPPASQSLLILFGAGFIVLGVLMGLGVVRAV
jgi:hypothetical protein